LNQKITEKTQGDVCKFKYKIVSANITLYKPGMSHDSKYAAIFFKTRLLKI